jgi:hypothetical protein
MKKCTTCLALFFTNLLCAAELNNLYQTIVLSQPVKKVVSQLQSDGTMSYSSRIDPVASRITNDGLFCLSRTKDGVTEVYDINNNSSQSFKTRADFKTHWAPVLSTSDILFNPGIKPNQLELIPLNSKEAHTEITTDGTITDVLPGSESTTYSAYTSNYRHQSEDLHLLMYDMSEQRQQTIYLNNIIDGHSGMRSHIDVDEKDSLVAYGELRYANIYDLRSGKNIYRFPSGEYDRRSGTSVTSSEVIDLNFNQAKKYFAYSNLYGQVYQIDLRVPSKILSKNRGNCGGYSIAYDAQGTHLMVGRSGTIDILNEHGEINYRINLNSNALVHSVFCDAKEDTWCASTSHNTLLKGAFSDLARKEEQDIKEAERRAPYDQLMARFYLLFYHKSEAERGGYGIEWTAQDEEKYQELEQTLRSMGHELGINDFC